VAAPILMALWVSLLNWGGQTNPLTPGQEFVGAGNFLPGRIAGDVVSTKVGTFPALNASTDGSVEVLIRPELLELEPDPTGDAEVVAREFRGHDVFYRLRAGNGTTLVSQRPSTEVVPLGARVAVRLHEAEIPVYS
jgi:ABC-type Fe3+/spermidine/putrescine transport system ATPase subunit